MAGELEAAVELGRALAAASDAVPSHNDYWTWLASEFELPSLADLQAGDVEMKRPN